MCMTFRHSGTEQKVDHLFLNYFQSALNTHVSSFSEVTVEHFIFLEFYRCPYQTAAELSLYLAAHLMSSYGVCC